MEIRYVFFPFVGLKLTAIGSKKQGIYVLDIVPGSPASQEGSLQPYDKVVCICGLWTEGMSLDDAVRECDAASHIVRVRATRYAYHVPSYL